MAKTMHTDHGMPIHEIWQTLHMSRATFYRYMALAARGPDTRRKGEEP
jgi:predicted DNA-binding transcriptional regulator AlpA